MIDGFEVIDAHVHVQPWEMFRPEAAALMKARRGDLGRIEAAFADPGRLVALLDEEGVRTAFLINYVAPEVMGFTEEVNDWVASFCKGRGDRLVPVGSVHPKRTSDPEGDVDRLIDKGIRAIKIHPPHMLFHANAYRDGGEWKALGRIYGQCEKRRLPVIVHTGTSVFQGARNRYADPIDIDDVAVDYPGLPLVMAHGGRPLFMQTCFFLLRRHANLSIDLSGIPPSRLLEYFPRLEEIADRAIWGTDWPSPGVVSMTANVRSFLRLPLPDDARRTILSENALRLLGGGR